MNSHQLAAPVADSADSAVLGLKLRPWFLSSRRVPQRRPPALLLSSSSHHIYSSTSSATLLSTATYFSTQNNQTRLFRWAESNAPRTRTQTRSCSCSLSMFIFTSTLSENHQVGSHVRADRLRSLILHLSPAALLAG